MRSIRLLLAALIMPSIAWSQRPSGGTGLVASQSRFDFRVAGAAVVTLEIELPGGRALGSGVLLDSMGTIATAAHVIAGATRGVVRRASGEELPIEGVLDIDTRLDIAIVRVSGFGLPYARLGNSDSLRVGDKLFAIGSPEGLEQTLTEGILSADRMEEGVRKLQVSVPVSHGSSGGPVFDAGGTVVGLIVSGIRGNGAENLNFAVPINYVRGKLALVGSRELKPLGIAAGNVVMPTQVAGSSSGFPSVVNRDLGVDWAAIDGLDAYQEWSGDNGWKFKGHVAYRAGLGAQGDSILERSSETDARVRVAPLRVVDAWVDRERGEVHFGSIPSVSTATERMPKASDVQYRSFGVEISGGVASFTNNGSRTNVQAPAGTIPVEFIPALIAGLPDSLPAQLFVWIYNPDNGSVRAERIDFAGRVMAQVSVAEGGQCAEYARTHKRTMPVVLATFAVGVQRRTIPVLATRPHLNVDPETVKCIAHPSLSRAE